jgi:hypothetical protein
MLTSFLFVAVTSLPAPTITWVKISEPMEGITWSVVNDIDFVDRDCRSDNSYPRVCLYRHVSKCRIISLVPKEKLSRRTIEELIRMCGGYFPEPVLLRNRFSDPLYLPNQGAPSNDPAWKFQTKEAK